MKPETRQQGGGTSPTQIKFLGPQRRNFKKLASELFLSVAASCPITLFPFAPPRPHSLCRGAPPGGEGPIFSCPLCIGPRHTMLVKLGVPDSLLPSR